MYIYDTYRDYFARVENRDELEDFIAAQEDWLVSHLWMASDVKVEAVTVVVTPEMMEKLV